MPSPEGRLQARPPAQQVRAASRELRVAGAPVPSPAERIAPRPRRKRRGAPPHAAQVTTRFTIAQMNVSLRPLEDRDLDAIYEQVTDPEAIRMAAFTVEDQTDRRAFLDRMSRVRANTTASNRVIEVDGEIAGTIASFRIDNQLEVTYWVDRSDGGRASRAQHYRFFLPRLPNASCTPERPRTMPVRFESWRRLGSDALASTAAMHPVGVRRSRKRSSASTEVGTEPCLS